MEHIGGTATSMTIETPTLPLALRFISGKYQGGEFPVPVEGEIIIGRSSELDMVLVEDMVSRRHARITVEDGEIFLEDLGSTNGSFVNGEKITKLSLAEGDRILIGTSIIKVVAAQDEASIEEAKARMADASVAKRTTQTSTMTGSIAEVALPDLLQLFSASKKNGELLITTDTDIGHIHLNQGRVNFAVVNDEEGVPPDKAFYRILQWTEGTFDLLADADAENLPEFENPIQMSIEGLLMEGMRQLDEIARIADDLPPPDAPLSLASPLETPLRDATPEELDSIQLALNHGTLAKMRNHSETSDVKISEALIGIIKKGYIVAG